MTTLTPKQERFAQAIANGENASEAYRTAGFSDNRGNACRLKQSQNIMRRVSELTAARAERDAKAVERAIANVSLSKEWVLQQLIRNVERATGDKYEGSVANKALELLGKEMGMFIDRKEVGRPNDFSGLSTVAEVLDRVRHDLGDEAADAIARTLERMRPDDEAEVSRH